MLLTCDSIDAPTAERLGLVSRVVPEDKLVSEAVAMGQKIASFSKPIGTAYISLSRSLCFASFLLLT